VDRGLVADALSCKARAPDGFLIQWAQIKDLGVLMYTSWLLRDLMANHGQSLLAWTGQRGRGTKTDEGSGGFFNVRDAFC